ncbi:MAG: SPOR domain-containing protein [Pseudomonadota bacterium]
MTALRREDTPTEVPEEEAGTAEALPEAEDVQTASLEPAAGAPAATERVDAGTSSSEADAPSAAGVAGDAGATPNERAAAQDKPAKQRWNPFRRRVADPLNALSTDPVPLASAGTAVAASAAATSDTPQLAVELPPATPETDEAPQTAITATPADASASPPEKQRWNPFRRRETEPLSALGATSVSGAAAGTIVSGQGVQTDEIVTAELKPQNVSAAPPSRTTSALDQPYLQIGIFSVEGNAETTAELLRRNGVVPTVFEQETQGKSFWRVVVGPAKTARDRSALLGKVKDLGFNDAYAVTR